MGENRWHMNSRKGDGTMGSIHFDQDELQKIANFLRVKAGLNFEAMERDTSLNIVVGDGTEQFGRKVAEDEDFVVFDGGEDGEYANVHTVVAKTFSMENRFAPLGKHLPDLHATSERIKDFATSNVIDPHHGITIPESKGAVLGPHDLPKLRMYLLELWGDNRQFQLAASVQAAMSPDIRSAKNVQQSLSLTERTMLKEATLWWVSAEMVDLLVNAAESLPSDVKVNELPIPAHTGLVVFEKPIIGSDAATPGNPVVVDAYTWGTTHMSSVASRPEPTMCLSFSAYKKLNFDKGLSRHELELATHMDLLKEAFMHPHSQMPGQMHVHGTTWCYLGRSDWPHGDELMQSPFTELSQVQVESFIEDRRIMAAFFTMIAQESIAQTEYHPIPRAERRRAERSGIRKEANDLKIVTLRKVHRNVTIPDDDSTEEVTGPEWSHRWMVNPHYRWQRVGPGRQERKLTLVRGYIKGPDDKPFKAKQEVKAWVRE